MKGSPMKVTAYLANKVRVLTSPPTLYSGFEDRCERMEQTSNPLPQNVPTLTPRKVAQ